MARLRRDGEDRNATRLPSDRLINIDERQWEIVAGGFVNLGNSWRTTSPMLSRK
jgi:hypothetical protein